MLFAFRYNQIMKIKLTTENKLGLSKEILALIAENDVDVKRVEVVTGIMYLETEELDKHVERDLASKMMQIDGVKWVESINLMPAYEKNLFLTSLLNAVPDPVFGINNKGLIIYLDSRIYVICIYIRISDICCPLDQPNPCVFEGLQI